MLCFYFRAGSWGKKRLSENQLAQEYNKEKVFKFTKPSSGGKKLFDTV